MKFYYEHRHDLANIRNKLRLQYREKVTIAREKLLNTKRKNLEQSQHFYKTFSLNELKNMNLSSITIDTPFLETLKRTFIIGEEYVYTFIKNPVNISTFQNIFKSHSMELQTGVTGVLVNMTLYSHVTTYPLIQAFSPYLITILESSNPYLQEVGCQVVANMLADCHFCAAHLQSQGGFPILSKLTSIFTSRPSVICFALNAFARSFPLLTPGSKIMVMNLLFPTISPLLQMDDIDFNKELLRLIFHFTVLESTCIQMIQHQEILFCLLEQLEFYAMNPSKYVTHSTLILRCLANIIGHCPPVGVLVVTFPDQLQHLLSFSKCQEFSHLRKEIFWLLTNILAGSQYDSELKEAIATHLNLLPFMELLPSTLHTLNSIHTINQALHFLQAAAIIYQDKIPWQMLKSSLTTLANSSFHPLIDSQTLKELILLSHG